MIMHIPGKFWGVRIEMGGGLSKIMYGRPTKGGVKHS
jgi:hypothetical protein